MKKDNKYIVRINVVKDDEIEIQARSEAEAIEKAEELVVTSALANLNISGISKHYIVITTNKLKKTKNQIIINGWFVFF